MPGLGTRAGSAIASGVGRQDDVGIGVGVGGVVIGGLVYMWFGVCVYVSCLFYFSILYLPLLLSFCSDSFERLSYVRLNCIESILVLCACVSGSHTFAPPPHALRCKISSTLDPDAGACWVVGYTHARNCDKGRWLSGLAIGLYIY